MVDQTPFLGLGPIVRLRDEPMHFLSEGLVEMFGALQVRAEILELLQLMVIQLAFIQDQNPIQGAFFVLDSFGLPFLHLSLL